MGALGGVAIPRASYNAFCREVWAIKQNVLGANSLSDCEIKGNNCFAKSAFRKREGSGHSRLLQAAEETLAAIPKYGGYGFAVWTIHEQWMMLRNPDANSLSPVYRELLVDFRRCVRRTGDQGLLFFDNRGRSEDMSAACAIQNFLVRVNRDWRRCFVQTPHFTISAVSPGLQAADLIAYLAAHRNDPTVRRELGAYWEVVEGIAFRGQRLALRAATGSRKGRWERTPQASLRATTRPFRFRLSHNARRNKPQLTVCSTESCSTTPAVEACRRFHDSPV